MKCDGIPQAHTRRLPEIPLALQVLGVLQRVNGPTTNNVGRYEVCAPTVEQRPGHRDRDEYAKKEDRDCDPDT